MTKAFIIPFRLANSSSLVGWEVLGTAQRSPNIRAQVVGNALPIPAGFCWLNPCFAQNLAGQSQKPLQFVSSLILRLFCLPRIIPAVIGRFKTRHFGSVQNPAPEIIRPSLFFLFFVYFMAKKFCVFLAFGFFDGHKHLLYITL